jgi:hypothetical protein
MQSGKAKIWFFIYRDQVNTYQAVRQENNTDGTDLISSLKKLDENVVFNPCISEATKTRLGQNVPKGSVLSYQLSLMEGIFNVENIDSEHIRANNVSENASNDP